MIWSARPIHESITSRCEDFNESILSVCVCEGGGSELAVMDVCYLSSGGQARMQPGPSYRPLLYYDFRERLHPPTPPTPPWRALKQSLG